MGIISNMAESKRSIAFDREKSRAVWREVFGTATDKEEGHREEPVRGGSYGRSTIGTNASIKRLLQAMRSMAPGGWSDDRWEQTRHFVSIQYLAIHRLATQWQQSEFQISIKDDNHPDGKRPVTPNDPPQGNRMVRPWELKELLGRPNNQDGFGKIMYRWCVQKYLTGTALTWMVPNALGVPMELYSIPTAVAIPQPAVNPDFPDGYYRIQPIYPYGPFSSYPTPASAVGAPIPAQWMMRFVFPHPLLRYEGYSPLTALRLHIDEVESIDRSRWYSMRRSINPSAVLNFDDMEGLQPLSEPEIERIRAEWEADFQSPENHGRLIVGTPGGRLEPWGAMPKDMDYQGGWDQLVSFVLSGFGITKPAAGMVDEASYASLFATLKQLHLLTLKPDVEDVASDITRYLAPFFGDNLIVEIRCPRIDDHDLKMAKLDKLAANRAITKNELRKELDMPLTKEEWGGDMAGDPTPKEQEIQQQSQMAAQMPTAGAPLGAPQEAPPPMVGHDQPDKMGRPIEVPEELRDSPLVVEESRPTAGPLDEDSRNPLKFMNGSRFKHLQSEPRNFYDRVRRALKNGHS
jgi:phage portal protein BeeE